MSGEKAPPLFTISVPRRRALLAGVAALSLGAVGGGGLYAYEQWQREMQRRTPHNLTERDGELIDQGLLDVGGDGGIAAIAFKNDKTYTNGSIQMIFSLRGTGHVGIIGREVHPNPGGLVRVALPYQDVPLADHPIDNLHRGDVEEILIGTGSDEASSFQNMRVYRLSNQEEGLVGTFQGLETPPPFQYRPNQ